HLNIAPSLYNHMTLERAQKDICTADQFIGHIQLTIQGSGHTPAFEYAMQEDLLHLAGTSGKLQISLAVLLF
ncbi:hypothetical protein PISMIDRAFT_100583, partial [Pisolithus microcarpus 441]